VVQSSLNVMSHGDARAGKWRENWRMEWEASTLHITSEHGLSSITTITTADAHTSAASSRLNWQPRRFKWTRPFRRKTKSGFCACAITFQTQSKSRFTCISYSCDEKSLTRPAPILTAQQFHELCIDIWTELNKLANIYIAWNILQKYYIRSLGLSLIHITIEEYAKNTSYRTHGEMKTTCKIIADNTHRKRRCLMCRRRKMITWKCVLEN